jgi:hypothetical protein
MKQKDIALLIGVAGASMIVSILLSRLILVTPKNRQQQVEVVQVINSDFPTPDSNYFNEESVNPTKLIQIGDTTNQEPFNSGQ